MGPFSAARPAEVVANRRRRSLPRRRQRGGDRKDSTGCPRRAVLLGDRQHSCRSPLVGLDPCNAGGALLRNRPRSRRVLPPIRAGWDSLGLGVFGAPEMPETNSPPYGGTHTLVTDLTPQGGFVGTNAHGAPSNDLNTPLGPDGTPVLLAAWRYLLTAREGAEEIAERDDT